MSTKNFEKLFNPTSIAVVGGSANEGHISLSLLKNLQSSNFQGEIFMVKSKANRILGNNTYASIADIEDNIDLAIIGESLDRVPSIIREGAKKNMKGVIVVTANCEREKVNNSELTVYCLSKNK